MFLSRLLCQDQTPQLASIFQPRHSSRGRSNGVPSTRIKHPHSDRKMAQNQEDDDGAAEPPEGGTWLETARAFRAGAALPPRGAKIFGPVQAGAVDEMVVVAQIGQSLDGRIATATGHSHYINGHEGLAHLHRLRALVDAVVVGIGTVLADDPQLTVRRVAGPHPARVVIDPRGRLPACARMLVADGAERLVVTAE